MSANLTAQPSSDLDKIAVKTIDDHLKFLAIQLQYNTDKAGRARIIKRIDSWLDKRIHATSES